MSEAPVLYRRVLLKLSGEALMGELDYAGVDTVIPFPGDRGKTVLVEETPQ